MIAILTALDLLFSIITRGVELMHHPVKKRLKKDA